MGFYIFDDGLFLFVEIFDDECFFVVCDDLVLFCISDEGVLFVVSNYEDDRGG